MPTLLNTTERQSLSEASDWEAVLQNTTSNESSAAGSKRGSFVWMQGLTPSNGTVAKRLSLKRRSITGAPASVSQNRTVENNILVPTSTSSTPSTARHSLTSSSATAGHSLPSIEYLRADTGTTKLLNIVNSRRSTMPCQSGMNALWNNSRLTNLKQTQNNKNTNNS